MLRQQNPKKQQPKQQKPAKSPKPVKAAKSRLQKRAQRSTHNLSKLPDATKGIVQFFTPDAPALDLCNNMTPEQTDQLFSSKLPHTTKSLQKMEFFIMNLQKSLVTYIEHLEAEMPPACMMQVDMGEHAIPNIPEVKANMSATPKFSIERSTRDPQSGMTGGGVVAVLQGGNVFEKAGCNTSVIHGMMPIDRLNHMRADHKGLHDVLANLSEEEKKAGLPFSVAGISLVFHPHNPHHPTVHANYRMFQIHTDTIKNKNVSLGHDGEGLDSGSIYWFGGGADLTPTYVESEGPNSIYGQHFHQIHKDVLDAKTAQLNTPLKFPNNASFYEHTKKWADQYFFLPHRGETRGLGGIFYDDFDSHSTGLSQAQMFEVVCALGDAFAPAYFPLLAANADAPFTPEQKQFQQLRRGRYVEFNVMYDRGTKFGLQMPSNAHVRTEQILMSLPLTARYEYCHTPAEGSAEANTLEILRNPINWA